MPSGFSLPGGGGRPGVSAAPHRPRAHPRPVRQSLVAVAATAGLVALASVIVPPCLVPVAWAAVLASATWPVYRRLLAALAGRPGPAAALMTSAVVLAIVLPVGGLSLALGDDVALADRTVRGWAETPPELPGWVRELPVLGPVLEGWYAGRRATPGARPRRLAAGWALEWSPAVLATAGDVGRSLGRLGLTLLTLVSLDRHGEALSAQLQRMAVRLAGETVQPRLALIGRTVRGVRPMGSCSPCSCRAGSLPSASGWWASAGGPPRRADGPPRPAAVRPPARVAPPVGLWALVALAPWRGVVLLRGGALGVSGIDDVLRPSLIGGPARVPFLLVFFGVLGGPDELRPARAARRAGGPGGAPGRLARLGGARAARQRRPSWVQPHAR
jgi:predicted PurR-regulated permease PerM